MEKRLHADGDAALVDAMTAQADLRHGRIGRQRGCFVLPRQRRRLRERVLQPLVGFLELRLDLALERLGVRLRENTFGHQLVRVLVADGRLLGDPGRHQRLRVGGLVLLVVAVAAVADEIDDHVVLEPAAVGHPQAHRGDARLGVVGVDVDDREVEALREVARVARRASLDGIRREADLVVCDQVERAAGRVAVELREVERLGDNPLRRKGGVAVDQYGQRDAGVVPALAGRAVSLLRTRPALDDRVDRLEVAGVGGECHREVARRRGANAFGAEVVLDVARTALGIRSDGLDRPLALELAEDRLVGAADHVREHVQASAVSHADHDLVRATLGCEVDRLVEHRDHRVETLDRELLLPEEDATEVVLESFDLRQASEQALLLVRCQLAAITP